MPRTVIKSDRARTIRKRVKRRAMRYGTIGKIMPSIRTKIFNTVRTCLLDPIVIQPQGAPATDTQGALSFKLSDLPSYSEYTSLFDYYRIKCVILKLTAVSTQQMVTTNNWSGQNDFYSPMVYSYVDTNDATAPASMADALQNERVKSYPMTKSKTFKIYPKTQQTVYQGVTSAYGSGKNVWIDTDYPNALYYGFKYYINTDGSFANVFTYRVICKYYIQLKDAK